MDEPKSEISNLSQVEEPIVPKSRLRRSAIQHTRKTIFLTIAGIAAIVVLLIFFGIPLLINLSLIFEKSSDDKGQTSKEAVYIAPPFLDPMPQATNSATTTIKGSAQKDDTVLLFVNDEEVDEKKVDDANEFAFDNIKLEQGENSIKAKVKIDKDKLSDYSDELRITVLSNPPELSVDYPNDGKSFEKDDSPIEVRGKTEPNVKVTVNGYQAIVNTEGNFTYNLPLQGGDNHIKVIATDQAGNQTEKEVRVTYSQ